MRKIDSKTKPTHLSDRHPDQENYADFFPYYAEFSALSEFRKKPGCGIELNSGIGGGHSVLYLNGVRVDRSAGSYPVLRVCAAHEFPAQSGAGISVNEHYRNANWIAVEGRDFFMRGALAEGEPLTRDGYLRTQEQAQNLGLYDAIEFQPKFFKDKPKGMSEREFKYELSIATDYGIRLGRDAYCARVPLNAARMHAIVEYLNSLNHRYREGGEEYTWSLFNNNCVHVNRNTLAQAGVLPAWPTGQWAVRAAFKFPVPKNTLVDLIVSSNDLPIIDPAALFSDLFTRDTLLRWGTLPTGPGALTRIEPVIINNDIYDVSRNLKLIFYDNPFWGKYPRNFRRILKSSRYFQLRENLRHFLSLYEQIPDTNKHLDEIFWDHYVAHIAQSKKAISHILQNFQETA